MNQWQYIYTCILIKFRMLGLKKNKNNMIQFLSRFEFVKILAEDNWKMTRFIFRTVAKCSHFGGISKT